MCELRTRGMMVEVLVTQGLNQQTQEGKSLGPRVTYFLVVVFLLGLVIKALGYQHLNHHPSCP